MYENKDMGKYFKGGLKSILNSFLVDISTTIGVMGMRGTPKMPWYVYEVIFQ
jgi:hypothetical protein